MRHSSQPNSEIPKWSRAILGFALSFSPAIALGQSPPSPAAAPATLAGDAQVEASYHDQLLRAQELARQGRRSEALALFQAAYALRQEPGLLLEIARLQHGLGLGAEAIDHYRRYLIADPAAPAAFREEAARAIAQPIQQRTAVYLQLQQLVDIQGGGIAHHIISMHPKQRMTAQLGIVSQR